MYLTLKIVHILSFTSWMAGLFYLPRIFVYHAERANSPGEISETFKVMEGKLYRLIMFPAMVVTWGTGIALAVLGGYLGTLDYWFISKFIFVLLITIFHFYCSLWLGVFKSDNNMRSGRFYRFANELPTLGFIAIVILVVLKPF